MNDAFGVTAAIKGMREYYQYPRMGKFGVHGGGVQILLAVLGLLLDELQPFSPIRIDLLTRMFHKSRGMACEGSEGSFSNGSRLLSRKPGKQVVSHPT